MRTDDLIDALAADRGAQSPHMSLVIGKALVIGSVVSLALFLLTMGVRPDFGSALATWRFQVKIVIVFLALGLAVFDCLRLSSPTTSGFASRFSLIVPVLVVLAVGLELFSSPMETWEPRLMGTNPFMCLAAILALALAPLAAAMWAMNSGAPASPAIAGAAIGRLAAATATALYSLHCFDDSPLFFATWYSLATLSVVAIGGVLGRWVLRW